MASDVEIQAALTRLERAVGRARERGAKRFLAATMIETEIQSGAGKMVAYQRAAERSDLTLSAVRQIWREAQQYPRAVWEAALTPRWDRQEHAFFVDRVAGLSDFLAGIVIERQNLLPSAKVAQVGMAQFSIAPKHRASIERWTRLFRQSNRSSLLLATNPDRARSLLMSAHGDRRQALTEPFERFAYDGSGKPVMTREGLGTVIVGCDEFSGRAIAVVGRSESSELTARLFARQCRDICVPRSVHSDHGSAFNSLRLNAGFERLGIAHTTNPSKYAGYLNPFGEATVHLLSRFAALEPGYIGRNVGERQNLRGRLALSERRGMSEAEILRVRLTDRELEEHFNKFLEMEADRPRKEFGGRSTSDVIQEWQAHGKIRRIEDPETLALLFAPMTQAVVTKRGVHFEGRNYIASALGALSGHRVEVRAYADADKIAIFSVERVPRFICIATDADSLCPDARRAEAVAARSAFRVAKSEIRKASRRLVKKLGGKSPAEIILGASSRTANATVTVSPFSTPALTEMAKGAAAMAELKSAAAERRDEQNLADRRWLYYCELIARAEDLTPEEEQWLRVYQSDPECEARAAS